MESERFDRIARTWATTSRRRVLAGLASFLAAARPLAIGDPVAARKKRKRKRNKKRNRCPAGQVRCNGQCGLPNLARGCLFTSVKCCSNRCAADLCIPCPGKPCDSDDDCCDGLPCIDTNDPNAGHTCGGCLHGNIGACQSSDDCCSAECNNGVCLSPLRERCATAFDCEGQPKGPVACDGGECRCAAQCCDDTDCVSSLECDDGRCTCPVERECCFDTDCEPVERCQGGTWTCVPVIGDG